MKTLAELTEIRDRTRAQVDLRTKEIATRFVVGTSEESLDAGARDVTKALLKELVSRGTSSATVMQDSNISIAGSEPVVEVVRPGHEKAVFTKVSVEDVPRIVSDVLNVKQA